MEIAKKKVKNFQFFLKAENKEKKNFFLNPKQEMSGKMLKLQKKTNFGSLKTLLS